MKFTSRRFQALLVVGAIGTLALATSVRARRASAPPKAVEATQPQAAATTNQPARADVTIDPRRQQLIGVRTTTVERQTLQRNVRTIGIVRYDETRLADINLKVEAWIRSLTANYTGQFVQKGQPLFTVYSPELLATQQEYVLALASREHMRHAVMTDTQRYADRLVDAARQRLALWDLSADQIQALEHGKSTEPTATFRSPVSGFVIEKRAVEGMHASAGESLYKIADLSVVWVEAEIYEQEAARLRLGAPATITLDAYPGERFSGRVSYINPMVEEQTRTVKARVTLANRAGRLKPGMYANVEIAFAPRTGLAVPLNAVLDSGAEPIVFVAQGDGHFEPRRVTLGERLGESIEIRSGLKDGEHVATGAAFFLDSESQLRSSLQGFEPLATIAPNQRSGAAAAGQVTLRTPTSDIKVGENQLEVDVKGPDGTPVTDAQVSVTFYMAAMPTMNMPAMRNEAKLPHVGNGAYRGPVTVMMAGRWEVSVIAIRDGQRMATQQLTVNAR